MDYVDQGQGQLRSRLRFSPWATRPVASSGIGSRRSCWPGRSAAASTGWRWRWRRPRCRRTTNCGARRQSLGHSAHVGQEVEVFYRWHPLYGRRVRQQYREQRANGEVVHVEVEPGIVIVVAAWMLSATVCARMELGAPRVSLDALDELHLLLSQQGLRRSCAGVCHTREERHEPGFQTAPTLDDIGTATTTVSTSAEHDVRVPRPPGHDPERTIERHRAAGDHAAAGSRRSSEGG